MTSPPPLRLGPWAVEPDLLRISREGDSRRLGPKVMAVLLDLGHRPGQVVTKEDLIERVWDGAFTSDEAVSAVVYELRKALDDSARAPLYLETIRGSGYRLLVPLTPSEAPAAADALDRPDASPPGNGTPAPGKAHEAPEPPSEKPSEEPPAEPRADAPPWRPKRKAALVTLGLLAAVVLLATGAFLSGWRGLPLGSEAEDASDPIRSLAVLPLGTFNEEERQDLFASALTDMLISDVAQLCPVEVSPGLAVRGRQGRWNLDQAARILGVDAVLEGSVLRAEDRFWISVQLVDTQTGRMLWSRSYDRDVGDELLVLREVALEIAGEIQGVVGGAP